MGRQFGIVSYLCVPGLRCNFLLCTLFYALLQLIEHLLCAGHCSISKGEQQETKQMKMLPRVCVHQLLRAPGRTHAHSGDLASMGHTLRATSAEPRDGPAAVSLFNKA